MTEAKVNLINLLDLIRKDSGINNAIGAMEQLSLLILLKYLYRIICVSNRKHSESFAKFFLGSDGVFNGAVKEKLLGLDEEIEDFAFASTIRLEEFGGLEITPKVFRKIISLIEVTPYRIQSIKILEALLYQLEVIGFDKSLAQAYDELMMKMIDESTASGEFHNPKALVSAIVNVIKPTLSQSIYDPALGTGRFIVESKKFTAGLIENQMGSPLRVFGKDISPTAVLIGSLNLLLNGIDIGDISIGDSLLGDFDSTYDVIFSGVPFGRVEGVESYKKNYLDYSSSLEAMFLKLAMEKLANGGKAALIVPESLLFDRSMSLVNLRRQLLTKFNLHSILSLPAGVMAPYSGIQVSVLFFEKAESSDNIWFYRVAADNSASKKSLVSDFNFVEFCQLFDNREITQNSWLIRRSDILDSDFCCLSFESLKKDEEKKQIRISDELLELAVKKQIIDKLSVSLVESLLLQQEVGPTDRVTLGELVMLSAGKQLGISHIENEGIYPVYGGNGVIGYYDQCNRMGENIILGRVGANCGNVHFVNSPIWLTDNSFSVHIKNSLPVYLPYLAHVLRSIDLKKLARGSAQPSISNATIRDLEIYLPIYEKQIQLSKWFDEIHERNYELQKTIQLLGDKFDELANLSIANGCVGRP